MSDVTWKSASIILFVVRADRWTWDKQFAQHRDTMFAGAGARRTLLYFYCIRFSVLSLSLSLSIPPFSFFLDGMRKKSESARMDTAGEVRFGLMPCTPYSACKFDRKVSSFSNQPPPYSPGKSLHVRWFYDERFRSGHYKIRLHRGKPTRS